MKQIVIRGLHTVLAADAFGEGESEVSPQILCLRGSEAEAFAVANGYDYAYLLK